MFSFKKLGLSDIEKLRPYLQKYNNRTCDLTVGGVFMWRDLLKMRYCFHEDSLIIGLTTEEFGDVFYTPLGGNTDAAFARLKEYCALKNEPLIFVTVTSPELERMRKLFPCLEAEPVRWLYDYIYDASSLRDFCGRKYAGQRNHINRFTKLYPDYSVEYITKESIPELKAMLSEYAASHIGGNAMSSEDIAKDFEILDCYDVYALPGALLRASGSVCAFSIGEIIGDTLFVHVEKALSAYQGVYQVMVREFVRFCRDESVKFVNREDDAGDEGLRKSKLSYHPCQLLEKYVVYVR